MTLRLVCGTVALVWLAGRAAAAPGEPPPLPTGSSGTAAQAGGTAAQTPVPPPPTDALLANLAAYQQAYSAHYDPPVVPAVHAPLADHGLRVFADGAALLMRPQFSSNPAYRATRPAPTGPARTFTPDFDYGTEFSPRVELGVENACGLGLRAGWFHFDQSATTHPTAPRTTAQGTVSSVPVAGLPGFSAPGPVALQTNVLNNKLTFSTHLKMDVWDWEAFKEARYGPWTLLASGGARYAYLSEDYLAARTNSGTATVRTTRFSVLQDADLVTAGHSFEGIGPTAALEAHRQLCHSDFSLYGTARTSVLFCDVTQRAFESRSLNEQITVGAARPVTVRSSSVIFHDTEDDEAVPVEDLEAGVEWSRCFRRARVFVRTGVVGQVWFDVGNATGTHGDLGFFGLSMTAGVDY